MNVVFIGCGLFEVNVRLGVLFIIWSGCLLEFRLIFVVVMNNLWLFMLIVIVCLMFKM